MPSSAPPAPASPHVLPPRLLLAAVSGWPSFFSAAGVDEGEVGYHPHEYRSKRADVSPANRRWGVYSVILFHFQLLAARQPKDSALGKYMHLLIDECTPSASYMILYGRALLLQKLIR